MSIFGSIFGGFSSSSGNDDITWYCDGCHAVLNEQDGFNRDSGSWVCSECGYYNDVTDDNVYESEEAYQEAMSDNDDWDSSGSGRTCVNCGMPLDGGYLTPAWADGDNPNSYVECPYCGCRNYDDEDDY